jgi:hypothetical protein
LDVRTTETAVSVFVRVTFVSATAAPDGSLTVPTTVAVSNCAATRGGAQSRSITTSPTTPRHVLVITPSTPAHSTGMFMSGLANANDAV